VTTRYLSRAHAVVYRISRGRFGGQPAHRRRLPQAGRNLAAGPSGAQFRQTLHHAIAVHEGRPNVIVVASAAGRDDNPQWYRTLLANPDAHVTIGAERRAVTALQANADERSRLWQRLVDTYADFESYQSWTDREIPVLVLKPR
jgi:F420H(2)-dependent quinone reductase